MHAMSVKNPVLSSYELAGNVKVASWLDENGHAWLEVSRDDAVLIAVPMRLKDLGELAHSLDEAEKDARRHLSLMAG